MEPASPLLFGAANDDAVPAELLAAFVEMMLESSRERVSAEPRASAS